MPKRRTLSGRTFIAFISLSLVIVIAVSAVVTAASFSVYEKEAEDLLMSQAETTAALFDDKTQTETAEQLNDVPFAETRCTLIDSQGTVLYDNWADASTMENHANRQEFIEAKENKQDVALRKSETLGSDTLYAAILLKNGSVLRLAETRTSLPSFLGDLALPLSFALMLVIIFSFLVSRALTHRIVRPLQEVDLNKPLENDAYQEMQPLLERVDKQREDLTRQNKELEAAVEARREFTGNVSHEMKTPLQVISGYAELMENGMTDPADNKRFAGLIHQEAQTMRTLIDDVLTISKLDESVEGAQMEFDLAGIAKHTAARLEARAQERSEHISVYAPHAVNVYGSPSRAEQLVYNLIDNAIRYNREGGKVSVYVEAFNAHALLAVSDEGAGIPEDMRERVFERFFRLDSSRNRETGGTGLGLAIVKHAAESFNGTVRVEDSPTGGASFIVEIPLAGGED